MLPQYSSTSTWFNGIKFKDCKVHTAYSNKFSRTKCWFSRTKCWFSRTWTAHIQGKKKNKWQHPFPWLSVLCNIALPEMPAERNCLEFSKAKSARNLSILQDHLCLADSGLGNYLYNWLLLWWALIVRNGQCLVRFCTEIKRYIITDCLNGD